MDTAASPAWLVNSFNLLLPVHFTAAAESGLADALRRGCFKLHERATPTSVVASDATDACGSTNATDITVDKDAVVDDVVAEVRRALQEVGMVCDARTIR